MRGELEDLLKLARRVVAKSKSKDIEAKRLLILAERAKRLADEIERELLDD